MNSQITEGEQILVIKHIHTKNYASFLMDIEITNTMTSIGPTKSMNQTFSTFNRYSIRFIVLSFLTLQEHCNQMDSAKTLQDFSLSKHSFLCF